MSSDFIQLRICVDVPDLEKGIAFYTAAFGLNVGRRLGSDWVELLGGPAAIDLLANSEGTSPAPNVAAPRDYRRHWTPVHLDFAVKDLVVAVKRCVAAGASQDREIQERKWGRLANFSDPFGNGLCLLEFRGRGYDELL